MATTWTPAFSDNFTRTSAGSLGNGWLDPGNNYSISGNQATPLAAQATAYEGNYWAARPIAESTSADTRVVLQIPAAPATNQSFYAILRGQGDPNAASGTRTGILMGFDPGGANIQAFDLNGGSLGNGTTINVVMTGGYNAAHPYTLDAAVTGTTVTLILTDATTGTVVATGTGTTAITGAGFDGFLVQNSTDPISSFVSYNPAAPATGYTLAASPTSATTGNAVTITATLAGGTTLASSLVITLADSLGATIGGTITIASGATTGTATVTPSAAGTHNITATHTGGGFTGGDGSTSFTAAAATTPSSNTPVVLAVAGVGHWCTPLNFDDNGTGPKQSNGVRANATIIGTACNGAEGRFTWTTPASSGNVATLGIDLTDLVAGNVPTGSYPLVKFRINEGAYHTFQVQAGSGNTFSYDVTGAGVTGAGTYTLHYFLMATDQGQARWTPVGSSFAPPMSLKITGLTVDPGSTPVAPFVLPKTIAVFSDSTLEGVRATGTMNGDIASNDSTLVYARALAAERGAELAAIGFGAQGYTHPGNGGVPAFPAAFGLYAAGRPRDFTASISEVFCLHGTNDGLAGATDAAVTSAAAGWLAAARSAFGSATVIHLTVPFGGFCRSAITAAQAQYQASTPDALANLVDLGTGIQLGLTGFVTAGTKASVDGVHPNTPTHGQLGSALAARSLPTVLLGPADELALQTALADDPAILTATTALKTMLVTINATLTTVGNQVAALPTVAALNSALAALPVPLTATQTTAATKSAWTPASPCPADIQMITASPTIATALAANLSLTPAQQQAQLTTLFLTAQATAAPSSIVAAPGSIAAGVAAAAALVIPAPLSTTQVTTAVQAAWSPTNPCPADLRTLGGATAPVTQLAANLGLTPAQQQAQFTAYVQTAQAAAPPTALVAAPGSLLATTAAAAQSAATAAAGVGTSTIDPNLAANLLAVKRKTDALFVEAGTGAVVVAAAGLENVMVEPGINLRQAASPTLAATTGAVTGAGATGNGTAVVMAPQATATPAVQRFTCDMLNGTRTNVKLSLPTALPAPVGV